MNSTVSLPSPARTAAATAPASGPTPVATAEASLAQRYGLDSARIPEHVAIIMDGNGRWANRRGMHRLWGHHQGYRTLKKVVRAASDFGIGVLTLYVFSSENWKRPKHEVEGLMHLIEMAARNELRELHEHNVRMRFTGRIHELPDSLQEVIRHNEEYTRDNTGLTLNLCVNYGGRTEIVDAARRLVEMAARGEITARDVTPETFGSVLYSADLPDPDLMIRTAGEMRVSNYLLWQIAYAELWVTEAFWPEFSEAHLAEAIRDFQGRTRKFGGIVNS
jgi:undecaprenyl diphosphate synthase